MELQVTIKYYDNLLFSMFAYLGLKGKWWGKTRSEAEVGFAHIVIIVAKHR